jgi:hypothetical protein
VLPKDAFLALLQERRFEEALNLLYASREHAPGNPSISRAIHVLKDRLLAQYRRQVGSMDRVPTRIREDPAGLSDERAVWALVDGVATVADVVECCSLGQFRTMQLLLSLSTRGIISLGPAAVHGSSVTPSSHAITDEVATVLRSPAPPGPILTPGTMAAVLEPLSKPPLPQAQPPRPTRLHAAPPLREVPPPPASVPPPPVSLPPPAASVPPLAPLVPAQASAEDEHEAMFAQALKAYLVRDYATAERVFQQCADRWPDDTRVQHNLRKLRERSKRS